MTNLGIGLYDGWSLFDTYPMRDLTSYLDYTPFLVTFPVSNA